MIEAEQNIFIVEDDEDDRDLIIKTFRHLQIAANPRTFSDGDELFDCLDLCQRNDLPSLIILDYNLPRLNGEAILLMLKKDLRYAPIPVVVFSTLLTDELGDDLIRLGAVNCIQKPSKIEDFQVIVENFVEMVSPH